MASLWEMMGGGNFRDPSGREDPALGVGDVLAQNRNSLIGLGLGYATGGLQGALAGYGPGAQADATGFYRQQQLAQHAADQKRQADQFAKTFGLQKRQFERGGESPFSKVAQDLGLRPGTPEYLEAAKMYHMPKVEGDWGIHTDPNTDQQYWLNKRTREFKPLELPGAASAAPDPWANVPRGGDFTPPSAGPMAGPATLPPAFGSAGMSSAPAAGGPAYPPPRIGAKAFEPEQKLRKEFEDTAKPYITARQAYTKMNASQDNAAGDIALIFGYMKMLDPPSTVREGEFATAQNSGGIEDRIRNTYNRLLSGERLTPQQREQFKGQGEAVWKTYESEYLPRIEQFKTIARQHRIDPARIIPDLGPFPARPAGGAPKGDAGGKKPAVQKWTTDANGNPIPVP